ncbi:MAG: NUDIX domain-containing protein [Thermoplasmata archaeon]|nr:NUDIX domain-containing protein [Thermoplasmata archaeon]
MAYDPPIDEECVEGYLFASSPPKYLILPRPPERGAIWVPVSGKVQPADADFRSAVRREIDEETLLPPPERHLPRVALPVRRPRWPKGAAPRIWGGDRRSCPAPF